MWSEAVSENYKEEPIDIIQFIEDPMYLGNSTSLGADIYKVWKLALIDMFCDNSKILVVLTGAIGCLGPDVKVKLLDGRSLTIPEIIEERNRGIQHWTYSYDIENDRIVPGRVVDALLSGRCVETVRVEIDNGKYVECTKNHPFLLSNLTYKRADELIQGDSLMPLYVSESEYGYEVIGSARGKWRCTFKVIGDFLFGKLKRSFCVHHRDFNKKNNNPENLRKMNVDKHFKLHQKYSSWKIVAGAASRAAKNACLKRWTGGDNGVQRIEAAIRLREMNLKGLASRAGSARWNKSGAMKRHLEWLKIRNAEGLSAHASECRWNKEGSRERYSKKIKEYWKRVRSIYWEYRSCLTCNNKYETQKNSKRKFCCHKCSCDFRKSVVRNHKVVSVKEFNKIDVYDLSIETFHNFALESGVFVHNTGKSTIALIALAYIQYRLMILKDPWGEFSLADSGRMTMSFFNLNKTLGDSRGYTKLQNFMIKSPWFRKNTAYIQKTNLGEEFEYSLIKYNLASPYCFTADTKISLLDGRELEIIKIIDEVKSGKKLWVYSYDRETNRIEAGFITDGFLSYKDADIIRVVLDNGSEIRCTSDHKFLMRNGEYKEAKLLKENDSIMPLYRNHNEKGYERFLENKNGRWIYTHRRSAGSIPKRFRGRDGKSFKNHKVVSVELCGKEDVYDITVEKYGNFALTAGVFVKNSKGFGIVGEDVVAGILDEVDSPIDSIKQKQRIIATYDSTVLRFKSRFASTGYSIGKLFIVSSKQDELSFIDTFVASRKNSPEVIVFDIPLWEAKPKSMFSGIKFPIAVGDAYNPPKIIEDGERETYAKSGFRIVNVPVEFKIDFQLNLIGSLRDIAGITIAGARKSKLFSSERFILQCFDEEKQDPIAQKTIRIGLEDDDVDFINFVDLSLFRVPKNVPRFIHLDISFSGDASGIAMSCVKDWKHMVVAKEDGTFVNELSPIIETDLIMRIKAKDGDRIPIHKVRKFILDLRASGVNVYLFSADLRLASEDTLQLLSKAGIRAEYFSVDKTSQPYIDFRNMAYERRWVCHKHNMLFFELKHLEQSQLDGKIDHPKEVKDIEFLSDGGIKEVVMEGSKDLADAVAGSVAQCLMNSKMPVDMTVMRDLMSRTASKERAIMQQDDMENILPMKDQNGNKIIAVKQPDGIVKVTEIIKRIHGR
jgi:intein/homing endonuclease